MKQVNIWLEAMRLRTLPVSISGVLMAIGITAWQGHFEWQPAMICLAFALLAQIASNFANEYYDYKKGSDKKGRVGPRRGVTEGDIKPATLRNVTYLTLAAACAVGCCLIPYGGWKIIPVGILIAIFVLAYSAGPYPLSYHGLGELTVFIFYGLVPVIASYYVIADRSIDALAVLASMTIGFMGVNVLLVNNYRDMDDDKEAGKNTAVVIFGRQLASSAYLFNGFMAIAMLSPLWVIVYFGDKIILPKWTFIAPALYLILHLVIWAMLNQRKGAKLNPLLGLTALNMLIFTIIMLLAFTI
ncbi:MAG: 1,4-dihydroxy-2-naphthoate octaprenyltransferase [Muribaculaceae bacterium]|nr:1,4-dihydroxy-2-naphthoate octaprenyltransferase [Muribaculaceae bacterium]